MAQETAERPIGVVLIALPYCLQALVFVLLAILLSRGLGTSLMCKLYGIPPQLFADDSNFVIDALLLAALISGMMGYGIWSFRPWARRVCLYTTGLSLLKVCVRLFLEAGTSDFSSAAYRLFCAALSAVIIWYLMQPDIKARFRAPGRATSGGYRSGTIVGQEISPMRMRAINGRPAGGQMTPYRPVFRQQ